MSKKTIEFTLDGPSVSKAVEELEKYIENVKTGIQELVKKLAEEGATVAMVQIAMLGAVDSGALTDSIIGYYDAENHVGIIRADAPYAFFVEYGTGVMGEAMQHPEIDEAWAPPPVSVDGYGPYTKYDTKEHGDKGWYYYKEADNKVYWTKGMPSRPFMYETYKELEQMAPRLAAEIFNRG